MPTFLENIFAQLKRADARVVLREIRGEQFVSATGGELLEMVGQVRTFLRNSGLQPGDRCALLAPNSIQWVAFDLALIAEGVIVVPLSSAGHAATPSTFTQPSSLWAPLRYHVPAARRHES